MRIIQPITGREKFNEMKMRLLKTRYKSYLMFAVGINIGLRIRAILELKVKDLKDKTYIGTIEQKRNKTKRFLLNLMLKQEINKNIKLMAKK